MAGAWWAPLTDKRGWKMDLEEDWMPLMFVLQFMLRAIMNNWAVMLGPEVEIRGEIARRPSLPSVMIVVMIQMFFAEMAYEMQEVP